MEYSDDDNARIIKYPYMRQTKILFPPRCVHLSNARRFRPRLRLPLGLRFPFGDPRSRSPAYGSDNAGINALTAPAGCCALLPHVLQSAKPPHPGLRNSSFPSSSSGGGGVSSRTPRENYVIYKRRSYLGRISPKREEAACSRDAGLA